MKKKAHRLKLQGTGPTLDQVKEEFYSQVQSRIERNRPNYDPHASHEQIQATETLAVITLWEKQGRKVDFAKTDMMSLLQLKNFGKIVS